MIAVRHTPRRVVLDPSGHGLISLYPEEARQLAGQLLKHATAIELGDDGDEEFQAACRIVREREAGRAALKTNPNPTGGQGNV